MTEKKSIDYKKVSAELDGILERLQSGELDVDEAIKQYERGMQSLQQLQTYLDTAENSVHKIKTKFKN